MVRQYVKVKMVYANCEKEIYSPPLSTQLDAPTELTSPL